ncbi:MAG: colanic acid biosynthesis acetyltransferase WcaF [Akkermansiaceae bacterium]|nr:colanic acid biosynthesis acetyltransferase WcaF [Akkermansiaceae bacterium]
MRDLSKYSSAGFDRGASRMKEALWWLTRATIFLSPLPFPSALKTALLRLFGAKIGDGVVIRPGVSITFPWRFHCGDHVWLGEDVLILSLAEVTIGSHSCISQRAFLCTGSHDYRKETFDLITKPIVLEKSVWISANAFVGPGVTVGEGTVVAALSSVVKDLPSHVLAAGNPAEKKRDL